jgi:hypothetical protein
MANEQNLIPFSRCSESRQREIRQKGNKAYAEKTLQNKFVSLALTSLLGKECEFLGKRMTNTVALATSLVEEGKNGNVKAIAEIMDRTEGKPTQKIEANVTTQEQPPEGLEEMYRKLKENE